VRVGAVSKLRFGILCRGLSFPRWQAECLEAALATGLAEPALLIVEGPGVRKARIDHKLGQRDRRLFNLYNTLIVKARAKSYRRVDLSATLGTVPRLVCDPEVRGSGHRLDRADVAAIRGHSLDFIIRFGFDILAGEILSAARYGVWSYHHGDEQRFRGAPPGFWEIFYDEEATGVLLQRLTERLDNGSVLFKGRFRTALTYPANVDRIYLGSADWIALCIKRIVVGDSRFVFAPGPRSEAPILRAPTNRTFLRFGVRQIGRIGRIVVRRTCFADDWNVGHASCSKRQLIDGMRTEGVTWAAPRRGARYLADPMVVQEPDGAKVYAEEYRYFRRGRLVSLDWPGGFSWDRARVECDLGHHASYPFVFRHHGALWMVPESCALRKVVLLKKGQSGRWERACDLIDDAVLADPTLLFRDERWWLFAADGRDTPHTCLLIFHAPTLTGPWAPHRLNPVKVDVTGARPAGPLFEVDGILYRPAQDCAGGYGRAITIHRVTELSCDAFSEVEVARIEPARDSPYPDGVHTLAVAEDGVFLDGNRKIFRPQLLPARLGRWFAERRHARTIDVAVPTHGLSRAG
jgi:hypothetical protein